MAATAREQRDRFRESDGEDQQATPTPKPKVRGWRSSGSRRRHRLRSLGARRSSWWRPVTVSHFLRRIRRRRRPRQMLSCRQFVVSAAVPPTAIIGAARMPAGKQRARASCSDRVPRLLILSQTAPAVVGKAAEDASRRQLPKPARPTSPNPARPLTHVTGQARPTGGEHAAGSSTIWTAGAEPPTTWPDRWRRAPPR